MDTKRLLEERQGGIGGSDLCSIMDPDAAWRTPYELWLEKTGRAPPKESTLQMEFGTYAEEFVAKQFEAKVGRGVQRYNAVVRHERYPFLIGHLDRLVVPAGAKVASFRREIRTTEMLECKTVDPMFALSWGEEGSDDVPKTYWWQLHHYLGLSPVIQTGYLAALVGNRELRVYQFARDQDLNEMIVARCVEWWERHVVKDTPPPPICASDVELRYPSSNGKAAMIPPALLADYLELIVVRRMLKALEERKEALSNRFRLALGEASKFVLPEGKKAVSWDRASDSSAFDLDQFLGAWTGALPEERDYLIWDIKRTYRKSVPGSRRFLVNDTPKGISLDALEMVREDVETRLRAFVSPLTTLEKLTP